MTQTKATICTCTEQDNSLDKICEACQNEYITYLESADAASDEAAYAAWLATPAGTVAA